MAEKDADRCRVLVISRSFANEMFVLSDGRLIFTDEAVLEDEQGIRLESTQSTVMIRVYPADALEGLEGYRKVEENCPEIFGTYQIRIPEKKVEVQVKQVGPSRYTVRIPEDALEDVKDMRLQLEYTGDIGTAFINGRMIHDNFANGAVWEIGLRDFEQELKKECITVYIVPLKEGVNVNVESAMAARSEEVKSYIEELKSVRMQPVYEITI